MTEPTPGNRPAEQSPAVDDATSALRTDTATTPPLLADSAARSALRTDLHRGILVVAALTLLGVVLGLVWAWWSPAVPAGENVKGGLIRAESEAFVAADGRFAVICILVGTLAGVGAWFLRSARGTVMALALAVGGLAGALLTALIGYLVGGGTTDAPRDQVIPHLTLVLQMRGLVLLEAIAAVLVYSVIVAFAARDDLGRPDDLAALPVDNPMEPPSVGTEGGVQYAGRYGDGPGLPQQHDLPPQQPDEA